MRPCIVIQDNAGSGKLREIVDQAAAEFAREKFVHGRNGAGGLVQRDALDAGHGEKERGDADALAVRLIELADEVIEGIQVDSAHGDSRGADAQKLAPNFFLRAVQADDDDGMRIHGVRAASFSSLPEASVFATPLPPSSYFARS